MNILRLAAITICFLIIPITYAVPPAGHVAGGGGNSMGPAMHATEPEQVTPGTSTTRTPTAGTTTSESATVGASPSGTSAVPPGIEEKGSTPSGLTNQSKTPEGWNKGNKEGWENDHDNDISPSSKDIDTDRVQDENVDLDEDNE